MALEPQKLKYGLAELSPVLSETEVDYHYNKHTTAYFSTINKLIVGTVYETATTIDELITKHALMTANGVLWNTACQAWNHDFYWAGLCPAQSSSEPTKLLKDSIDREYGSFDKFKAEFTDKAMALFGSGWIWLVCSGDRAYIKTTPNTGTVKIDNRTTPLLVCDVWEHAYLYDDQYVADRKTYVNNFWNIVNWELVNERYSKTRSN